MPWTPQLLEDLGTVEKRALRHPEASTTASSDAGILQDVARTRQRLGKRTGDVGRPADGRSDDLCRTSRGARSARKMPISPLLSRERLESQVTQSRCAGPSHNRASSHTRRIAASTSSSLMPAAGDVAAHRLEVASITTTCARSCSGCRRPSRWRSSAPRDVARTGRLPDIAGTTSLTLVAATNRLIGSPARLAIRPAVRFAEIAARRADGNGWR